MQRHSGQLQLLPLQGTDHMLNSGHCLLHRTSSVKEAGEVLLARSTDHCNYSLNSWPRIKFKHSTMPMCELSSVPQPAPEPASPSVQVSAAAAAALLRGPEAEGPGPEGEQGRDPGAGARPGRARRGRCGPEAAPPARPGPAASLPGPARHLRSLRAGQDRPPAPLLAPHSPSRCAEQGRGRTPPPARVRSAPGAGSGGAELGAPGAALPRAKAALRPGREGQGRAGPGPVCAAGGGRGAPARAEGALRSGQAPLAPAAPKPVLPKVLKLQS